MHTPLKRRIMSLDFSTPCFLRPLASLASLLLVSELAVNNAKQPNGLILLQNVPFMYEPDKIHFLRINIR